MGARVPDGYFNQTYMVEFEVPGALDGTTPSPDIDFAEGNDDPQQIFRPEVENNLGLIDVDYLVSELDNEGARGNRWVGVFWLDASVAGGAGAALEVVDAVTGASVTQESVAALAGVSRLYRRSGILVPQGSLLRISGYAAGPTPHRIRLHISYLTDDGLLFAQNVLCCFEQAGGAVETWQQVLQNGPASGGEDALMTGGGQFRLQAGSNIDFQDTFLINNDAQPTVDDAYAFGTLDSRWSATYSRMALAAADAAGGGTTEFLFGANNVGFIGGVAYAVPGATARLRAINPAAPIGSPSIVLGTADAEVAGGLAHVYASGVGAKAMGSTRAETAHTAILRATGAYSFAGGGARANAFDSTIEATGESSLAWGYCRPTIGATQLRATERGAVAMGASRYFGDIAATGPGSFAGGDAYGYASSESRIVASGLGSFAHGISAGPADILAAGNGSLATGYPISVTVGGPAATVNAGGNGSLAGGSVTAANYASTLEATGPGSFAFGRCAQDPGKSGPTVFRASGPGAVAMGVSYDENATLLAAGTASFVCGIAISYGASIATMEAISPTANGAWAGGFAGASNGYTARVAVEENGAWAFGKCAAISANQGIVASEEGSIAQGRAQDGSIYASGFGSMARGFADSDYNITASGDGACAMGSTSTGDIQATYENSFQFGPGVNAAADQFQIGDGGIRFKGTTGAPIALQDGDFWVASGYVYCRTNGVTKNLSNIT